MRVSRTVPTIFGPALSATGTVKAAKSEELKVIAELQKVPVTGRAVGKGSGNRLGRDASARSGDAGGASIPAEPQPLTACPLPLFALLGLLAGGLTRALL